MKRIMLLAALACAVAGCMTTPKPQAKNAQNTAVKSAKTSPDLAAEARLARSLPLVTADSITAQNAAAKATELAEELNRDSRRMDSARTLAEAPK